VDPLLARPAYKERRFENVRTESSGDIVPERKHLHENRGYWRMNVLVVAAHPDDELLGVGGTIVAHVSKGDRVMCMVMCEGVSLRYDSSWDGEVRKQAQDAARILGVTELKLGSMPDQRLETMALCELTREIEACIKEWQPEIIYTHFGGDVNRDHRIVSEAVLVAARPYSAPSVKEILMFETPSSTEWGTPSLTTTFQPNVYVDVSDFLQRKIDAFSCYTAEVRDAPHPRSLTALANRAQFWGSVVNRQSAEAFLLVRSAR
jgi:N-acetylglucosamine malate deacetylase 1